ncbi:hypothetical protein C8039_17580 [Halogeometricum sp. wsp3]|nr:hypothetical protein C8039_17580 [Halogeometricum sp. wsp3]
MAITIGLGVDYAAHVTHRFADEFDENDLETALDRTVRGTGGALFGSCSPRVRHRRPRAGCVPRNRPFGILTALSSGTRLASLLVIPSALVVWDRVFNADWSAWHTRVRAVRHLTLSYATTDQPVVECDRIDIPRGEITATEAFI